MQTRLPSDELAVPDMVRTQPVARRYVTRPFAASSGMLAIYVFTMIAWSEVSEQSAQYSKLAGLALIFVFAVEFLLSRQQTISVPKELGILTLFLLWNAISLFWADDPAWAVVTVKMLFQLLVFWFISVNVMVFFGSIVPAGVGLLAGLAWAIFGALKSNQMHLIPTTDTRIGSVLNNANAYAIALALGILTGLYLWRLSPHLIRWLLIGFIVLAVHQIFFYTGSRKGMIGVVLVLGLYFSLTVILNERDSSGQIVLFLVGCIVAYFVVDWLITNSPFGNRLFGLQDDASFTARENLISFAVEQVRRSPIIGHGANQFRVLHESHFGISTYSHSNYSEVLVNNGLIGLAIFYSFHTLMAGRYFNAYSARRVATGDAAWAFTMIILLLLWDVALVSSEGKLHWIMFAQLAALHQIKSGRTDRIAYHGRRAA